MEPDSMSPSEVQKMSVGNLVARLLHRALKEISERTVSDNHRTRSTHQGTLADVKCRRHWCADDRAGRDGFTKHREWMVPR